MMFQTIDAAKSTPPVDIFAFEETTAEPSDSNSLAISCCSYMIQPFTIDPTWENDVDE